MTVISVPVPRHSVQTTKGSREQATPYLRLANHAFAIMLLIGMLCILLRFWGVTLVPERGGVWVSSLANCLMWTLACPPLGGGLGFLFGIPKAFQRNASVPVAAPLSADATSTVPPRDSPRAPTSPVEVSDWITKIFIGLGMIYLTQVFDAAIRLARILAREVNPAFPQVAFAFSLALILLLLVAGFIYGYLLTRMFLQNAFVPADQQARLPNNEQTLHQAQELGRHYETTRMMMSPSDPQRIVCLNTVVRDMQKLAPGVSPLLAEFAASESLGERLVAITSLQVHPVPQYIPWLGERISSDAPCLRYHAALALLSVAQAYGSDPARQTILFNTLTDALASLERNVGGPEKARQTDTYEVLHQALNQIHCKSCCL